MSHSTWIDSHGRLYLLTDEPGEVLARAAAAGVARVMCPGIDVETSMASRTLARQFPDQVWWSAGLHPHDASSWPRVADEISDLVVEADAVGECGLDYYRELSPRGAQRVAFSAQLALATALDRPIIVHCRDAFADVHAALADANLGERAILHCWTGGARWTKRFAALGATFSFAGPLTFATGETLRLAAKHAPRDRTMVETDAPYLTPEPHRGEVNEPARVVHTGAVLAGIWGLDVTDVAASTTATATRLFG